MLTVRSACPVVLSMHAEHVSDGGMHVVATVRVDRRELGIEAPRVLIGREVTVELDLTFRPHPR